MRSLPAKTFLPICLMTSENTERWSFTVATSLHAMPPLSLASLCRVAFTRCLTSSGAAGSDFFPVAALYALPTRPRPKPPTFFTPL